MELYVEPAETKEIHITWTPQKEGNMRESLHWRTSIGVRSQTVILGSCINPQPKKVQCLLFYSLIEI